MADIGQTKNPAYIRYNRHAATSTVDEHATVRDGGGGEKKRITPSDHQTCIRSFDTNHLISLPGIPFSSGYNVPQLEHFTLALRNADENVRVACDRTETVVWPRGWDKYLGRNVLRSMRASYAKAVSKTTLVTGAFAQRGKLLDASQND